jgi:hypothetical protein
MVTIGTVTTAETSGIVAEKRNVRVGNFAITEAESGEIAFAGIELSAADRQDFTELLYFWKYGTAGCIHGGHALSEAEIIAARAWFAEHRGE